MSDISDDDLANNYGPTTPAPPRTKAAAARARAGGKPVAGPSTKPPSKAAAKRAAAAAAAAKAANAIELDNDDSESVEFVEKDRRDGREDEDEDEVVAVVGPPKGASKKASTKAGSTANGTAKTNGVGKAKARAEHPVVNGDAMEVDEDEGAGPDDEPPDQPAQRGGVRGGSKQPPLRVKNTTNSATAARQARENQRLLRDMERLRAQLEQQLEMNKEIAKHRDRLAASLEELSQLRNTEPEQTMKDMRSRHEEEIKRKDSLIQELTGQLKQSPSSSNQSWTLHFLTREAAEEEKRALRDENARLKDVIKQHSAVVAAKDQQIAELKQEADLTKKELNAEIERSKQLASRPGSAPHAVTPNGAKAARGGEPSNLPVIKLYEDMTNVLVTHVAKEPSADWPGIDEDLISCVYSYNNAEQNVNFSLQFALRNQFDRPDNAPGKETLPKERLIEKVKYIPKNLEMEKAELVERLQFFRDPFMFSRDQMTVFLKTLTDTIATIFEGDEDAGGPGAEDEPIMVE